MKCQNGTSSFNNYGGRRYLPHVFTEHGITMLAGILKSDVAVEMSLKIVDTFIAMRRYLASGNYHQRLNNIETKIIEHDNKLEEVFSKMEKEKKSYLF